MLLPIIIMELLQKNGTKCEVKYGRINEVGNTHVVPNSIYEKALKRYEELLYQPLSTYYEKKQ